MTATVNPPDNSPLAWRFALQDGEGLRDILREAYEEQAPLIEAALGCSRAEAKHLALCRIAFAFMEAERLEEGNEILAGGVLRGD